MARPSNIARALAGTLLMLAAIRLPAGEAAAPSLTFDVQPILDAQCVQCHLLESPQGGLVLESGEAYRNLVEVRSSQAPMLRVTPGQPDQSYLLHKLHGTHARAGGSGQVMPFGNERGAGLAEASVKLIAQWVLAGAPDN